MPIPGRNGYYTGQMFTNDIGERYVWIGSEWRPAGNDNYTPVQNPREVTITFNTFLEEGGVPVEVKVLVNGNEWSESKSTNGKCVVKFFDYQILNPTTITFLGNNVKAKKQYSIQARVNQENDVVITEFEQNQPILLPSGPFEPTPKADPEPLPLFESGGGGSGTGGSAPNYDVVDRLRDIYNLSVSDESASQRENIR